MDIQEPRFRELIAGANSRFDLWERVIKAGAVDTMLEVGVWRGEYAKYVLERCSSIRRYYMIDPWTNLPDWNKPFNLSQEAFSEVYDQAMLNTEFAASRRVVLRGRTKEVIATIPNGSLDFAYLDGDHTLRGITIDLIKLFPKVREGGFLAGDDFTANPWQHEAPYDPTLVCPFSIYFSEAMGVPIMALPFNQFIIQKHTASSFVFIDTTGRHDDTSIKRPPRVRGQSVVGNVFKKLWARSRVN